MGFLTATKNSVCYAWLFEFMLQEDKSTANTCLNLLGDMLTVMIAGLYFIYISQEWTSLLMVIYFMCLIAFIVVIFIGPESPKWLLL